MNNPEETMEKKKNSLRPEILKGITLKRSDSLSVCHQIVGL